MRNKVSVGPLPESCSAHLNRKLSHMNHVFPLTALMATIGCLSVVAQQGTSQSVTSQPVTSQMLLDGLKDPTKWLMFGGDYTSRRNSPLMQLTPQNVNRLTPQWLFQTPAPAPGRGLESTPVVVDGVIYITGNYNHAWALDARTGRTIWHYQRTLPSLLRDGEPRRRHPGRQVVYGHARRSPRGARPEDWHRALGRHRRGTQKRI